MATGFWSTRSI